MEISVGDKAEMNHYSDSFSGEESSDVMALRLHAFLIEITHQLQGDIDRLDVALGKR